MDPAAGLVATTAAAPTSLLFNLAFAVLAPQAAAAAAAPSFCRRRRQTRSEAFTNQDATRPAAAVEMEVNEDDDEEEALVEQLPAGVALVVSYGDWTAAVRVPTTVPDAIAS